MTDRMDNYVEVKDRLTEFYAKYPEGSIESHFEFIDYAGKPAVVVTALAYRTPNDPHPATGLAKELIPGSTSFTRGSELEVCQTSAWGRALGALGIGVKGAIASAEEVAAAKARRDDKPSPKPSQRPSKADQRQQEWEVMDPTTAPAPAYEGPEDPWLTPVDPETGEEASLRPAEAVVEQILGGVKIDPEKPLRTPVMHKKPPAEKSLRWAKSLIQKHADRVGADEIDYLNAQLSDLGFPEVDGWDAIGQQACSKIIDALKAIP